MTKIGDKNDSITTIGLSVKTKSMVSITSKFIYEFLSNKTIELKCTQPKLCIPIIERLYRKMMLGVKFSEIKVDADLICDGHHRYLASLVSKKPIEMAPSLKTYSTRAIDWNSVLFDENDWDTPAKIIHLNQQDAKFNDIPYHEFVLLLSKV